MSGISVAEQMTVNQLVTDLRWFESTFDACVNWCAEGFAIHPEWLNDPNKRWNPAGNSILRTLRILQGEMDEDFRGRFKQ